MSIFSKRLFRYLSREIVPRHLRAFTPLEIKTLRSLLARKRAGSLTGFTLMELLVVIAIMFLITSLILFNQTRFNSAILLRNLAYEVGFSIHEAQLYGVAVRGTSDATFDAPYGVEFDNTAGTLLNTANSSYPLFADTFPPGSPDGQYSSNPGSTDALIDTFKIQNGFFIKDFCAYIGTTPHCASTNDIKKLDILFKRPNPNAIIVTNKDGSGTAYTSASITVGSRNGASRTITVWSTGFIDVNSTATVSS